jgi:hypothetical protein
MPDILKTPAVAVYYVVPSIVGEYFKELVLLVLKVESTSIVTLAVLVLPTILPYISARANSIVGTVPPLY